MSKIGQEIIEGLQQLLKDAKAGNLDKYRGRSIPMNLTVGGYVIDELETREWSIQDFASAAGMPEAWAAKVACPFFVDATPDDCKSIAQAFGTSTELWLRLAGLLQ